MVNMRKVDKIKSFVWDLFSKRVTLCDVKMSIVQTIQMEHFCKNLDREKLENLEKLES